MPNKAKPKILYLVTKSNFGGAQKYVLEIATAAKEKGYEVTVACGRSGLDPENMGPLVNHLEEREINIIEVKNFQRNMSALSDLLAFFEIWRLLMKLRPDILHLNSSKAGGLGSLAGRLANIKNIIFTSHGLTMDETWRPNWQLKLINLGTWLTFVLSHKVILISASNFSTAQKMKQVRHKIHLISNGAKPVNFIERLKARKDLSAKIPPKSTWIGGIGELNKNKNWAVIIEAMASLPNNVNLVIIGEGEERKNLEDLVEIKGLQKRVHLIGFFDQAAKYLKAFDVFVLPSKKEGLPYVLLEAGLAELPVVASNLPGNQDIIDTGQSGFLVEPTANVLATTLSMLIRDEGMRRNLGRKLSEKVSDDFSLEKMVSRTLSLY